MARSPRLGVPRRKSPAGSRSSRAVAALEPVARPSRPLRRSAAPISASAAASAAAQRLALAGRARARSISGSAGCRLAPAALVGVGGAHHVRQARRACSAAISPSRSGSSPPPRNSARAPVEGVDAPAARTRRASSTRNSGSIPAASACARSTRAQKPWMVEIQAASASRAGPAALRSANRARTRWAQLGGRLLGEGDGQDRVHRHAVVQHGAHEALHQHGGLAGARAGADQESSRRGARSRAAARR